MENPKIFTPSTKMTPLLHLNLKKFYGSFPAIKPKKKSHNYTIPQYTSYLVVLDSHMTFHKAKQQVKGDTQDKSNSLAKLFQKQLVKG